MLRKPGVRESQLTERRRTEYSKESPWKRRRPEYVTTDGSIKVERNDIDEAFDDYVYANMDLDLETKRAAILVSPSVVSIVSLRGEIEMFRASGTIFECNQDDDGKYLHTILTSRSLLEGGDDVTVKVYLYDDRVFAAKVFAYDLHYNLALVNIQCEDALPIAILKCLDDSASVDPREVSRRGDKSEIQSGSDLFNLYPGEMVVAVGRHTKDSDLMVAPGQYSLDVCAFDCKELMRATCKISQCGIGGPLVNRYGEVIGVNFYDELYTPFLATNTVSKCLEIFKKHGRFRRPSHGMEVTNLYAAHINILEKVIYRFHNIFKGVIVEKVVPGSPADSAGILRNDVIVQCGENSVLGCLEFFGQIWDNVGESVELVVIRKGRDDFLKLSMVVADETNSDQFYRWPVPEASAVYVRRRRFRD